MSQQVQVTKLTNIVVCPAMGYMGEDATKVLEYLLTLSVPPAKVKCPKCGQEVESTKIALHLINKHCRVTGKNVICDLCGAKLGSMGEFMRHVREHLTVAVLRNGMWIWYCTVCGREFTSKKSVLVHILKSHEVED